MSLMSDAAFRWALSIVTGGVAGAWFIHDLVFIARLRGKDWRDSLVRDQAFGYIIGMLIGIFGVLGTLMYNGVI